MASQLLKINIPVSPTYRVQPWLFHGETLPANWRETIYPVFYPVFLDSPPSPHGISWSNKYKGFQTSSGLVGFNIYFQSLRRRGAEWRCYHSHRGCSLSFFIIFFCWGQVAVFLLNIMLYISALQSAVSTSASGCHSTRLFRILDSERC